MMRTLLAALLLALPLAARAADLPDRPVRIIVPSTPAGTSDILARLLADAAGAHLPRGAVVENRGGAGGNIGMAEARAPRPTARRWCNAPSAPAAPIPRSTPMRATTWRATSRR